MTIPRIEIKNVKGVEKVTVWLKDMSKATQSVAVDAVSDYLLGDDQQGTRHGLRHYVKYKYVTRRQAYGQTFVSDRQRRYVMAAISRGEIMPGYPRRTGRMQRGWKKEPINTTTRLIINREPHTRFVMGQQSQANQLRLVGWRKMMDVAGTNLKGAARWASVKVKQYLKKSKP